MKVGDRVEKMSTRTHYKIIDLNVGGKVLLQRLVNGGKSDNFIKVDDLNSFKLFKPIAETISFFDDDYDFLSNSFESPIEYDGIIYPSIEHAFQASKYKNKEDREKIKEIDSPLKVKVLGKRIKVDDEWEKEKYKYMYQMCLSKFSNNEELKNLLLATGNLNLINGGEDTYWGVSKDIGENNLGKILMQIREELSNN